ncbi:MAG TPA: hypothetical protein V6D30_21640 [Leptolyngbyaceae cyanobacterium]
MFDSKYEKLWCRESGESGGANWSNRMIASIYLRDPDGNLIEVSNYLSNAEGG